MPNVEIGGRRVAICTSPIKDIQIHDLNKLLLEKGFILTERIDSVSPADKSEIIYVQIQGEGDGILGTASCSYCDKNPSLMGQQIRMCRDCVGKFI